MLFNEKAPKMHTFRATCVGGWMFLQHYRSTVGLGVYGYLCARVGYVIHGGYTGTRITGAVRIHLKWTFILASKSAFDFSKLHNRRGSTGMSPFCACIKSTMAKSDKWFQWIERMIFVVISTDQVVDFVQTNLLHSMPSRIASWWVDLKMVSNKKCL